MEPSSGRSSRCRALQWTSASCPIHHQHPMIQFPHHHHLIFCPPASHHHHHLHHHHHYWLNSELVGSSPFQNLEAEAAALKVAVDHGFQARMLREQEHKGFEEAEGEDYDDDEPIFVLTDEWREFFAKSEAKRKLEKKQAKRKQRK